MGSHPGGVRQSGLLPIDPLRLVSASSLIAHYKFDGNLNDSSGNGRDLAVNAGYEAYVPDAPGGRKAFSFHGSTNLKLATAGHNAAFAAMITDYTVIALLRRHDVASHAQTIIDCSVASPSGVGDDGAFYVKLGLWNNATFKGGMYPGWKYVNGSADHYHFASDAAIMEDWLAVATTRTFDGTNPIQTRGWINGRRGLPTWPSTQLYSNRPQDASNATLLIGGAVAGSGWLKADLADLMVFDSAISEATIRAEFARCGFYTAA